MISMNYFALYLVRVQQMSSTPCGPAKYGLYGYRDHRLQKPSRRPLVSLWSSLNPLHLLLTVLALVR